MERIVESRFLKAPLSLVVVQPTSFCNIDCAYCYLPFRNQRRVLSLDTLRIIVGRLAEYPNLGDDLTICWHSGEPLTRGLDFFRVMLDAFAPLTARVRVSHSIQTNGTLITPDWASWFAAQDVHVGVSVDGPADMHDAHRVQRSGRGTHELTMRGIELLQAHGVSLGAIAVVSEDALANPEAFHGFFANAGIESVGLNVPEIEGENRTSWIEGIDAEGRFHAFVARLTGLAADGRVRYRELESVFDAAFADRPAFRSSTATLGHILNVTWDGRFTTYAPELLSMAGADASDFLLGNVETHTIAEALAGPTAAALDRRIQEGVDLCRASCAFFGICGGGSPSNKLAENGTFASAETRFCRLTKKTLTSAVLDHYAC